MDEVDRIFNAIQTGMDLELLWHDSSEKEKYIYAVFIWSPEKDVAEFKLFTGYPQWIPVISGIISSLFEDEDCQYFIGVNPLGYENDSEKIYTKLEKVIKIMRKDGVSFDFGDENFPGE